MSTGRSREAAIRLHEQGVNVVPASGKAPRGSWKRYTAERLTLRDVADSFANGRGDGNIYAITGSVSGIVVLDCDDEAAVQYWRGLFGGTLDKTAAVRTGGGGWHFWFQTEGQPIPSRASNGGPTGKWDFQADGKGVIAPPSIHESGRRYEWVREFRHILPVPPALLEAVREAASGPAAGLNGGGPAGAAEWEPFPEERYRAEGVPAGVRDHVLSKYAASLRGRGGMSQEDAYERMDDFHALLEQPPGDEMDQAHARRKIDWAWEKYADGHSAAFATSAPSASKAPAVATTLVLQAEATHEFVLSEEGLPYAVPLQGPRIAQPFRGAAGFRQDLASAYFAREGKTASSSAVADALAVLEGRAQAADRHRVHVRIAGDEERVAIDLGDPSGRSVVVTGGGWETTAQRGVLFRRTALTSPIAEPARGGSLDAMRSLLNITDESWDLLVGYMVASWIPEIPHPVLWLTGEQGTGKTSALRMVGSLLDPSPVEARTPPRDIQEWVVVLSGSWVVPVDNISQIPGWLSDAICRASTGDGLARRQLYGDNDLVVNKLRNVVMLNGISVGGFRGDLGERLLPVEFSRIGPERRRMESELRAEWDALVPSLFGALLDLLSATLAALPSVRLDEYPRMADFARVLAAVDQVRGTESLAAYLDSRESISQQVVEADPVGAAIADLAQRSAQTTTEGDVVWTGTATELLREIELLTEREHRGKDWPTNGQVLSGRLTRVAPDLARQGVEVKRSASNKKGKLWHLRVNEGAGA
ncbi:bifunctional DNA primase/polymerase [Baekduia sp. Peel2402]|uniref:bifunctional DNA primase/polymerase n=1 Tax=Baekduia sp. Peel2402 TaxID=3458296 RepID=UPI00403E4210